MVISLNLIGQVKSWSGHREKYENEIREKECKGNIKKQSFEMMEFFPEIKNSTTQRYGNPINAIG